jgi:hypothetical protein
MKERRTKMTQELGAEKCMICKKDTAYPDRIWDYKPDGTRGAWCTTCWNEKHLNSQYPTDVRHGDNTRGERST